VIYVSVTFTSLDFVDLHTIAVDFDVDGVVCLAGWIELGLDALMSRARHRR